VLASLVTFFNKTLTFWTGFQKNAQISVGAELFRADGETRRRCDNLIFFK